MSVADVNSRRSERTQVPLTRAHLLRLGELADVAHASYTRAAGEGGNLAAWSGRRVAVVLAQGAARHYLHPGLGFGVKDLDVWTFYAHRPARSLYPGRYEVHADFGPSSLGRNSYRPPMTARELIWDNYTGRRVDFLVRELPVRVSTDVDMLINVLRTWLARGARERCRHEEKRNSSAHHLAHKAMVWIGTPETLDQAGRPAWDVDPDFAAAGTAVGGFLEMDT